MCCHVKCGIFFSFCCGKIIITISPLSDFFVLQGTMRVSKHCNEAVVMTDGSSSKDSGDDAQETNNRHVAVKMFLVYCVNSSSFNRWFVTQRWVTELLWLARRFVDRFFWKTIFKYTYIFLRNVLCIYFHRSHILIGWDRYSFDRLKKMIWHMKLV